MKKEKNKKKSNLASSISKITDNTSAITKFDKRIMCVLVVIYTVIALFNLGSTQAPKTYYHFTQEGESVGLEIVNGEQYVSKIRYYTGPSTGDFTLMISSDGSNYHNLGDFSSTSVFAWEDLAIEETVKSIMFITNTTGTYLGDVQLYNNYGEKILVKATSDQAAVIVDELQKVPANISHLNSTYFDEVYFARSAYEYTHGLDAMEWVHPPLGKLLMSIPILLFGFSPFTYRLMGTIAGIIMIPVIYILAKKLFKDRKWGILAGILMAFDNFHFAQTRMGTVDSFLVLFILLACLFMKNYIDLDKEANFKLKRKNLLLSGLFIGCSIATKWTGLYALLGLGIIFFTHLFSQYEDGRRKKFNYNKASKVALAALVVLSLIPLVAYYLVLLLVNSATATSTVFWYYFAVVFITVITLLTKLLKKDKSLYKTFGICILAFILIPMVIYVLSYLLFPNVVNYSKNSISGIINQIKDMYTYHSNLTESHPFQSTWYQWPVMYKPVWYYVGYFGGNIKSTIVGIGNPVIWWFGIVAFVYVLINTIIKRNKDNFFVLMLILCTFLPYVFIGRAMFMYHYFPTLPFIMLAIVAFVKWITEKIKSNSFYIFYSALVIIMFFVFYPVVSGMLTTSEYIDALKWLSSWIF